MLWSRGPWRGRDAIVWASLVVGVACSRPEADVPRAAGADQPEQSEQSEPSGSSSAPPDPQEVSAVEVRVTVVDIDGKLVPGATVEDESTGDAVAPQPDGSFLLRPGMRIVCRAPGFLFDWGWDVPSDRTEASVRLVPESRIEGRVVEAGTGAPLVGLQFSRTGVETDSEGRFSIGRLAPGRHRLHAHDDEHEAIDAFTVGLAETRSGVELIAHPLVPIEATLLHATKEPCAEGSAEAFIEKHAAGGDSCDCSGSSRSFRGTVEEGSGTVRIAVPPNATYGIRFACEGELVDTAPFVKVGSKGRRGLEWISEPGISVRGRVVDQDGAPIENAEVQWRSEVEGSMADIRGTESDAQGYFVMGGLEPGPHSVVADVVKDDEFYFADTTLEIVDGSNEGFELVVKTTELPYPVDATEPLVKEPAHRATIEGVVRDEQGKPVAGAVVSVTHEPPALALRGLPIRGDSGATTDSEGRFELTVRPPDYCWTMGIGCEQRLVALRRGGGQGHVAFAFSQGPEGSNADPPHERLSHDVRLVERGQIDARVEGPRGKPIALFGWFLSVGRRPTVDGRYNPAGTFQVDGLFPGEYELNVRTASGRRSETVEVRAGETTQVVFRMKSK